MADDLLPPIGPAPFRFQATRPGHPARAFSLPFRLLALTTVLVGSAWLVSLGLQGALGSGANSGLSWFAAGLVLMIYTVWHIWTSRTHIDEQQLYQTWVWDKKLDLRDLAYCKLIRVRGLEWLIAPRLYARTLLGKFAVFYAADAELLADFERLVTEVHAFRTQA